MKRGRTFGVLLLTAMLAGGCASLRAGWRSELYGQARATLAAIDDAPQLVTSVHDDPRVLRAMGLFLRASDDEMLSDEQRSERFTRLMPTPPWEWVPGVQILRLRPSWPNRESS